MDLNGSSDIKSRVVLSLPHRVKHELKILAALDNQTISQVVLKFINNGIEKNREKLLAVFEK